MTSSDRPTPANTGQPMELAATVSDRATGAKEANGDTRISPRTLSMLDESMANLRAGVVGEPLDVDALIRAVREN